MPMADDKRFSQFRPHPWHGLDPGPNPPQLVHGYIEITAFDVVKYEIDKHSGVLRIDRPQRTSALPPSLYGFVPRTLCGDRTGALTAAANGGDGDPLDLCVLSERPITAREILVRARVIGGLTMVDGGEADDKIVAVLDGDAMFARIDELQELPSVVVERLRHYFATYKLEPGAMPVTVTPYERAHAHRVIEAARADYDAAFGAGAS